VWLYAEDLNPCRPKGPKVIKALFETDCSVLLWTMLSLYDSVDPEISISNQSS
jgi:hypothetical protein